MSFPYRRETTLWRLLWRFRSGSLLRYTRIAQAEGQAGLDDGSDLGAGTARAVIPPTCARDMKFAEIAVK